MWKSYKGTWKTFKEDGLVKIGTVIEAGGEKLLIGDINKQGGQCDCCPIHHSVITRYKPPETPKKSAKKPAKKKKL